MLAPAALIVISLPALGFEFPLTRAQRAQKLVEQGYERIVRGDYSGALSSCDQALEVRGDWAPAYICRSEARLWLKDPKSDRDARRAMRFDPASGDPYRLLGLWEFESKRYPAAISNFNRALELGKLKPDGITECYFYRAQARVNKGDLAGALEDISQGLGVLRGISGSYGDWSFYGLRAEIRRRKGDWDGADSDERQVLSLVEERLRRRGSVVPELLLRRAHANAMLERFEEAAADYERIFELVQDADARLRLEHAVVLFLARRDRQALSSLRLVPKESPHFLTAWRMAVLLKRAQGRGGVAVPPATERPAPPIEEACSWIEGSPTENIAPSKEPLLWGRQALALEMRLQHRAALRLAQKALARDPSDSMAQLAKIHALRGISYPSTSRQPISD